MLHHVIEESRSLLLNNIAYLLFPVLFSFILCRLFFWLGFEEKMMFEVSGS